MASLDKLNHQLLRSGENKDVAQYLLQLLKQHQPLDICNVLLKAVESGLLNSRTLSIFLSAAGSIECIKICLYQEVSINIRKAAIREFGKALAHESRWRDAWQAMGSTQGVLSYLAVCSVDEVREFCVRVAPCNSRATKVQGREDAMEELVKAMNPAQYPNNKLKTTDRRPLGAFAANLLPSCSSEFVQSILKQGLTNSLYGECSKSMLLRSHPSMVLHETVHVILEQKPKNVSDDIQLYLKRLAADFSSSHPTKDKFSNSMKFTENLLEKCILDPKLILPYPTNEPRLYFSLLKRCKRRRVSEERLHAVVELGLRLAASRPDIRFNFSTSMEFLPKIKASWLKRPEYWEDVLLGCLKLGIGGSKDTIGQSFLNFGVHQKLKENQCWEFFKKFCHVLTSGRVDLEKGQGFEILAKQRWSYEFFGLLPIDERIGFLENLLRAKPQANLLTDTPSNSILKLAKIGEQQNSNALIYLTQLQIRSSDKEQKSQGYERAVDAYEDLKSKSSSAREQPDRAFNAKAAGLWAIASGSLELFGSHISWLARFVQDPLTLKTVFAGDAIGSRDAAELLTGILDPLLPVELELSEISKTVTMANEVFLTLHEHYKTAKREPSFQEYDWDAMRSLLGNSISTRVIWARKLQDTLDVSDGELYSHLWSHTLSMFSKIDQKSRHKVYKSILKLFRRLPPTLLATVTQKMLELDNENRTSKAQGNSDDNSAWTLERMAYQLIDSLTTSDNPVLAKELVIRTVIERPDASSWHRDFLGIDFFKRLPAKDAEKLLLDFSKAIGEKLEEQSYVRLGEAANAPSIIKVTTVKYLAQLLQNAKFLSPEASIEVLVELFKVATHPDIRLATLESMLATLNSLAAAEVREAISDLSDVKNPLIRKVLEALDTVIPVIGSINERRPPKEQDWAEAADDLSKLPMPSDSKTERPLWVALVEAAQSSKIFKAYFVKHLLLPAAQISVNEHLKWLNLFLKKHKAQFSPNKLPMVPANVKMLSNLCVKFTEYTPRQVLDSWNLYAQFLLRQPIFVTDFTAKLEADTNVSGKADVKHFLKTFKDSINSTVTGETSSLIGLIQSNWQPTLLPVQLGISLPQVQAAIIQQAEIVLLDYDQNVSTWDSLVSKFRHPTGSAAEYEKWTTDCCPVLQQIVKMIDNSRTPQWEKNINRRPVILPTSLRPKLWAMDYPVTGLSTSHSDSISTQLGGQIVILIKDQLSNKQRLVNREKLMTDILTVSGKLDARQNLQVGLAICAHDKLESTEAVEEDIRVRLSLKFVAAGKQAFNKDAKLRKQVGAMIQNWQNSLVEEVRELVLDLVTTGAHGKLWDIIKQTE